MSQAQIAVKRSVAKSFAFEVNNLRGAEPADNFVNGKTKLVETELEMVRSPWLLQHCAIISRFCCLSRLHRIQRCEIDRRLQRRFGQSKGTSRGD